MWAGGSNQCRRLSRLQDRPLLRCFLVLSSNVTFTSSVGALGPCLREMRLVDIHRAWLTRHAIVRGLLLDRGECYNPFGPENLVPTTPGIIDKPPRLQQSISLTVLDYYNTAAARDKIGVSNPEGVTGMERITTHGHNSRWA